MPHNMNFHPLYNVSVEFSENLSRHVFAIKRNDAIILKIIESEVDFRVLRSND